MSDPRICSKRGFDRFAFASAALACIFARGYAIPQVLVVTLRVDPRLGIALFCVPTMAAVPTRAPADRKHPPLAGGA